MILIYIWNYIWGRSLRCLVHFIRYFARAMWSIGLLSYWLIYPWSHWLLNLFTELLPTFLNTFFLNQKYKITSNAIFMYFPEKGYCKPLNLQTVVHVYCFSEQHIPYILYSSIIDKVFFKYRCKLLFCNQFQMRHFYTNVKFRICSP